MYYHENLSERLVSVCLFACLFVCFSCGNTSSLIQLRPYLSKQICKTEKMNRINPFQIHLGFLLQKGLAKNHKDFAHKLPV